MPKHRARALFLCLFTPVYRLFLFILAFCTTFAGLAQTDTLRAVDTAAAVRDTVGRPDSLRTDTLLRDTVLPVKEVPAMQFDTLVYRHHPYVPFTNPVRRISTVRQWQGKDAFFYSVIGLLIFFAIIRNTFAKYMQDLFRLFFRSTLKQRQIKEQLMEAPLPSLLLNILFVVSGGVYLSLVFQVYGLGRQFNFWLLILYGAVALALIYLVKFVVLKILGWLFRIPEATDAYTFIVFTTNKIIGMALLPFIVMLAFTAGTVHGAALTLSFIVVGGLFLYRYFLAYMSIHRQVKLEFLHFVLYLLAFEIVPLLLINKLLFKFLG